IVKGKGQRRRHWRGRCRGYRPWRGGYKTHPVIQQHAALDRRVKTVTTEGGITVFDRRITVKKRIKRSGPLKLCVMRPLHKIVFPEHETSISGRIITENIRLSRQRISAHHQTD